MKFILRIIIFLFFVGCFVFIIAYGRGYRLNFKDLKIGSTGIIAISSYPKTAKIYVNGELKGVTDLNLTLPPGKYQIEIKKEGFTSWKKLVLLKGELVVNLEPVLFPINPSLSPISNLGIIKAIPLQETNKILVFSEEGIHIFEATKKPFPFFPPLKTLVKKEAFSEEIDFANAEIIISPDEKQAIINNYLISLEEENQSVNEFYLQEDSKQTLINAWKEKKNANFFKILETYPQEFKKIASESFKLIAFSPNETKILYQSLKDIDLKPMITPGLIGVNQTKEQRNLKKNNVYIYDKKEDKNYFIGTWNLELGTFPIQWYFDSKHLVIEENKKISIVDFDNENKQTIYSGPFEANFFTTTSDGKIIILANLNPEANKLPDLYLVGIR